MGKEESTMLWAIKKFLAREILYFISFFSIAFVPFLIAVFFPQVRENISQILGTDYDQKAFAFSVVGYPIFIIFRVGRWAYNNY